MPMKIEVINFKWSTLTPLEQLVLVPWASWRAKILRRCGKGGFRIDAMPASWQILVFGCGPY